MTTFSIGNNHKKASGSDHKVLQLIIFRLIPEDMSIYHDIMTLLVSIIITVYF